MPLGPVKQYSAEPSTEPVVLKVYPGADGQFRWYEDDGLSFEYEKGSYMLVHCEWDDRNRTLSLRRETRGALGNGRKIVVELVGEGKPRNVVLNQELTRVQL